MSYPAIFFQFFLIIPQNEDCKKTRLVVPSSELAPTSLIQRSLICFLSVISNHSAEYSFVSLLIVKANVGMKRLRLLCTHMSSCWSVKGGKADARETKIRGQIVSGLFVPVGHRVGEEQASGKAYARASVLIIGNKNMGTDRFRTICTRRSSCWRGTGEW